MLLPFCGCANHGLKALWECGLGLDVLHSEFWAILGENPWEGFESLINSPEDPLLSSDGVWLRMGLQDEYFAF